MDWKKELEMEMELSFNSNIETQKSLPDATLACEIVMENQDSPDDKKSITLSEDCKTEVKIKTKKKSVQKVKLVHSCDECDKVCKNLYLLNRHKMVHAEDYLKCKVCQTQFNDANNLQKHMFIHTNKKSYRCHICKQSFTFNCSLKRHLRIHTGVKPYSCDVCNKKFADVGNLRKHERRYHSKDFPDGPKPLHGATLALHKKRQEEKRKKFKIKIKKDKIRSFCSDVKRIFRNRKRKVEDDDYDSSDLEPLSKKIKANSDKVHPTYKPQAINKCDKVAVVLLKGINLDKYCTNNAQGCEQNVSPSSTADESNSVPGLINIEEKPTEKICQNKVLDKNIKGKGIRNNSCPTANKTVVRKSLIPKININIGHHDEPLKEHEENNVTEKGVCLTSTPTSTASEPTFKDDEGMKKNDLPDDTNPISTESSISSVKSSRGITQEQPGDALNSTERRMAEDDDHDLSDLQPLSKKIKANLDKVHPTYKLQAINKSDKVAAVLLKSINLDKYCTNNAQSCEQNVSQSSPADGYNSVPGLIKIGEKPTEKICQKKVLDKNIKGKGIRNNSSPAANKTVVRKSLIPKININIGRHDEPPKEHEENNITEKDVCLTSTPTSTASEPTFEDDEGVKKNDLTDDTNSISTQSSISSAKSSRRSTQEQPDDALNSTERRMAEDYDYDLSDLQPLSKKIKANSDTVHPTYKLQAINNCNKVAVVLLKRINLDKYCTNNAQGCEQNVSPGSSADGSNKTVVRKSLIPKININIGHHDEPLKEHEENNITEKDVCLTSTPTSTASEPIFEDDEGMKKNDLPDNLNPISTQSSISSAKSSRSSTQEQPDDALNSTERRMAEDDDHDLSDLEPLSKKIKANLDTVHPTYEPQAINKSDKVAVVLLKRINLDKNCTNNAQSYEQNVSQSSSADVSNNTVVRRSLIPKININIGHHDEPLKEHEENNITEKDVCLTSTPTSTASEPTFEDDERMKKNDLQDDTNSISTQSSISSIKSSRSSTQEQPGDALNSTESIMDFLEELLSMSDDDFKDESQLLEGGKTKDCPEETEISESTNKEVIDVPDNGATKTEACKLVEQEIERILKDNGKSPKHSNEDSNTIQEETKQIAANDNRLSEPRQSQNSSMDATCLYSITRFDKSLECSEKLNITNNEPLLNGQTSSTENSNDESCSSGFSMPILDMEDHKATENTKKQIANELKEQSVNSNDTTELQKKQSVNTLADGHTSSTAKSNDESSSQEFSLPKLDTKDHKLAEGIKKPNAKEQNKESINNNDTKDSTLADVQTSLPAKSNDESSAQVFGMPISDIEEQKSTKGTKKPNTKEQKKKSVKKDRIKKLTPTEKQCVETMKPGSKKSIEIAKAIEDDIKNKESKQHLMKAESQKPAKANESKKTTVNKTTRKSVQEKDQHENSKKQDDMDQAVSSEGKSQDNSQNNTDENSSSVEDDEAANEKAMDILNYLQDLCFIDDLPEIMGDQAISDSNIMDKTVIQGTDENINNYDMDTSFNLDELSTKAYDSLVNEEKDTDKTDETLEESKHNKTSGTDVQSEESDHTKTPVTDVQSEESDHNETLLTDVASEKCDHKKTPVTDVASEESYHNKTLVTDVQSEESDHNKTPVTDVQSEESYHNKTPVTDVQLEESDHNKTLLTDVQSEESDHNKTPVTDVQSEKADHNKKSITHVASEKSDHNKTPVTDVQSEEPDHNKTSVTDVQSEESDHNKTSVIDVQSEESDHNKTPVTDVQSEKCDHKKTPVTDVASEESYHNKTPVTDVQSEESDHNKTLLTDVASEKCDHKKIPVTDVASEESYHNKTPVTDDQSEESDHNKTPVTDVQSEESDHNKKSITDVASAHKETLEKSKHNKTPVTDVQSEESDHNKTPVTDVQSEKADHNKKSITNVASAHTKTSKKSNHNKTPVTDVTSTKKETKVKRPPGRPRIYPVKPKIIINVFDPDGNVIRGKGRPPNGAVRPPKKIRKPFPKVKDGIDYKNLSIFNFLRKDPKSEEGNKSEKTDLDRKTVETTNKSAQKTEADEIKSTDNSSAQQIIESSSNPSATQDLEANSSRDKTAEPTDLAKTSLKPPNETQHVDFEVSIAPDESNQIKVKVCQLSNTDQDVDDHKCKKTVFTQSKSDEQTKDANTSIQDMELENSFASDESNDALYIDETILSSKDIEADKFKEIRSTQNKSDKTDEHTNDANTSIQDMELENSFASDESSDALHIDETTCSTSSSKYIESNKMETMPAQNKSDKTYEQTNDANKSLEPADYSQENSFASNSSSKYIKETMSTDDLKTSIQAANKFQDFDFESFASDDSDDNALFIDEDNHSMSTDDESSSSSNSSDESIDALHIGETKYSMSSDDESTDSSSDNSVASVKPTKNYFSNFRTRKSFASDEKTRTGNSVEHKKSGNSVEPDESITPPSNSETENFLESKNNNRCTSVVPDNAKSNNIGLKLFEIRKRTLQMF